MPRQYSLRERRARTLAPPAGHRTALTAEQIIFLLDEAKPFQEFQRHPLKKLATLRGKTVALAFFEPSTRTRISFATAASRLGADTMNLQAESSSLKKGESLLDTVRTLDAMKPDCIVMRHSSSGAADFVARHLDIPVINAGDGTHEHPTQALLDALTIRDRRGSIENLNVTIIGDMLHSRVARSNIHLLRKFGCRFTLCGPAMWLPREFECSGHARAAHARASKRRSREPTWSSCCACSRSGCTSRRCRSTNTSCCINSRPSACAVARPDALVLHPGPMIRGLEIDPAVADGPQSCVLEQVTNGLAVRMALLFVMLGTGSEADRTQRVRPCCGLRTDA